MVKEKDGKMVISYGYLNDVEVGSAIDKLYECNDLPVKLAYRVGEFCHKLKSESSKARNKFGSLVKKYAKLDEHGKPLGIDKNTLEFESPDKEASYNSEFDVLLNESFEVDLFKMDPAHLKPVKLTSGESFKIGPFLDVRP